MAKIFISNKRNAEPDAPIAQAVHEASRQEHEFFIDTTLEAGKKWTARIQHEIKQAEYLICGLSELSVPSKMVIAKLRRTVKEVSFPDKPLQIATANSAPRARRLCNMNLAASAGTRELVAMNKPSSRCTVPGWSNRWVARCSHVTNCMPYISRSV